MAVPILALLPLVLLVTACAATSPPLITGHPRTAIAPDAVRVYTSAPAVFEEIAVLGASRHNLSEAGGERAIEKMIETLRAQAALLGANGLLLDDFSVSHSLSLGTGVGTDTVTHNGSISLGAGASMGLFRRTAKGRAIYVPPG